MNHPPEFRAYFELNPGGGAGACSQVGVGKGITIRENGKAKARRKDFGKQLLGKMASWVRVGEEGVWEVAGSPALLGDLTSVIPSVIALITWTHSELLASL